MKSQVIKTLLISGIVISQILVSYGQNSQEKDNIQKAQEEAYNNTKNITEGKNANYIPYLANVPSDLFGIVMVTTEGKIYKIGNSDFEFGIESISKIFVLALAMQTIDADTIQKNIGVNATGMPFNSVIAIELEGKSPISPIVNAGAMATNSLIKGITKEEQFDKILKYFSKIANRPLRVISELYQSEAATNMHNRAIAMLLASYGHMWSDPLDACESYTKQCSVGITAEDLDMMGSFLANGGIHPITKERLLKEEYVPKVLAVMSMEGLYQNTGDWMYTVGLPAKSGVGGGILAIVPGKMAIAVFAPPLDEAGNSVKAQKAIACIAQKLGFNIYKVNTKQ